MPEIRVPATQLLPGDTIVSGIRGAKGRVVTSAATTAGRSTLITVTCDPPSRYFTETRTTVTVDRPGARPAPAPTRIRAGRYVYRGHRIAYHRRGYFDDAPEIKDWHDQRCSGWYVEGHIYRFRTLAAALAHLDERKGLTKQPPA